MRNVDINDPVIKSLVGLALNPTGNWLLLFLDKYT